MPTIRRGSGYFQTTWGEQDVGGATDTWCVNPTPSMVNDSDFGVVICVDSDDDTNYNWARISWIKINIYYTEGRSQTDPTICGTGANEDRDGMDAWTNPANIQTDDENYAYCDVPKNEYTDWLRASQFGFSIPGGSTIHGIIVCARCHAEDYNVHDSSIRLVDASGSNVGDDKANSLYWPSYYGGNGKQWGSSRDTWNASPTPSMVNDPDFGVRISAYNGSGLGARYAYVYWVKITVFYTGAVEHYKTLTESLGLVDTAIKGVSGPKVEALGLSDTVVKAPSLARSELLGLVDGYSRVWAAYKVNAEALGLSDTVVKAAALIRTEKLGLADSVEAVRLLVKTLTELLGLTDSVTKSPSAVRIELLGLLDTYSRVWQTHQTCTEHLGLLDSMQKDTAHPLTEIVGLVDSLAKASSVVKSDLLGLSDMAIKDIARELVESLGLTDTTVKALVKVLAELLGPTDALSCSVAYHRTYTEALGLTDCVSKGVAFPLTEVVALVDAVGAMPNATILANLIRKYIQLVDIGEGEKWVS